MAPEEPGWWYGPETSLPSRLLAPAARAWGWVAERRFARATPYRSRLPVICVGNFTAGGTGKTPLSLLIAQELKSLGRSPAFLTRGYGGRIRGPHLVDAVRDAAFDVGDEPLLLAAVAPVMVSRDRAVGAQVIEKQLPSVDVIVMDDGLQNPTLTKNLSFAVVDGRRGLGNGRVIPAGPLRAPLAAQLHRVDAVVINEPAHADAGTGAVVARFRTGFAGHVLAAITGPDGDTAWLAEGPLVAYAAIGAPERFTLLRALGASVLEARSFPDHHAFREAEARELLLLAERYGARLVTTAKDHARLAGAGGAMAELYRQSRVLPVRMQLAPDDRSRLTALLASLFPRGGKAAGG